MPLLMIHAVSPSDARAVPRMLADVRDSGARALRCSPNNVWVMFHSLPAGFYLQGEGAGEPVPSPIVIAKLQVGRSREELGAFVLAVAAAVARGLELPKEKVWIQYEEMKREDVYYG